MHFLHISHSVRQESGGPAEGLRRILEGYRADGHTAEVLSFDDPARQPDDFPVQLHSFRAWQRSYGFSPGARRWLRANAGRFDGIVVHGLWQYQGLLALQELTARRPFLVFTHGMLDPWFNRTYPFKFLKKLLYWMLVERRTLASAHRVLFTSRPERELAASSFPLARFQAKIMPYGTAGAPVPYDPQQAAADFRRLAGLDTNEPYLLYAGRMHEKKGCDLLLAAYAQVADSRALPRLVMAGPDQAGMTPALRWAARNHGIENRVLWPGMLTGSVKWAAFSRAEAFLLPSHQENFGIAVAEALSCGTPVLISNQVNIHTDISRCDAGYVEPDTLDGTVRLLQRWAATPPQEREAMRSRSVACWRTHFNSAGTARAIVELFQAAQPLQERASATMELAPRVLTVARRPTATAAPGRHPQQTPAL